MRACVSVRACLCMCVRACARKLCCGPCELFFFVSLYCHCRLPMIAIKVLTAHPEMRHPICTLFFLLFFKTTVCAPLTRCRRRNTIRVTLETHCLQGSLTPFFSSPNNPTDEVTLSIPCFPTSKDKSGLTGAGQSTNNITICQRHRANGSVCFWKSPK